MSDDDLLADYRVVLALPVQWGDQDSMQHVNNVVYFRWCESARIAYFGRIGLADRRLDGHIGPILASIQCNFRRQLSFPDMIRVGARLSRIGRTSLTMEHLIVSDEQRAVVADATSTIVVIDYDAGKPHPVPEVMRRRIEELEGKTL